MPRAVRYRVVNKIAHGGMAEIFLALQRGAEGFEKPVVLKRILPALAADPKFVRMLVDEAHIASSLNHSNLVQVLDLGKSADNRYFLVLEFVDGWSLEHVRQRARKARMKFPLPLALYITGVLCRGLAYVHTRTRDGKPLGIVHRDVSPQNLLISREGDVKLADFGIAMAIDRREKSATGVIKGKFAYMSPEQSMGAELDARSDLFAVGTLLYLLTTGRKPFEGATDVDVLMKVRKARYEKPSTFMKDFNPDVERFIARALRSERSKRWQSAEQMANRIDALLVKIGQPAGPGQLKRWLDTLSARDGVQPPAIPESSSASGTVELGTQDLELEEVETPPPSADDAAPPDAATRAGRRRPVASAAASPEASEAYVEVHVSAGTADAAAAAAPLAAPRQEAPAAPRAAATRVVPARAASTPMRVAPSRTRTARLRRWVVRLMVRTMLLAVLLGVAAYFTRPYLPAWAADPIDSLLDSLHLEPRR
jgi:serine/threonine protein kinase